MATNKAKRKSDKANEGGENYFDIAKSNKSHFNVVPPKVIFYIWKRGNKNFPK